MILGYTDRSDRSDHAWPTGFHTMSFVVLSLNGHFNPSRKHHAEKSEVEEAWTPQISPRPNGAWLKERTVKMTSSVIV